ncbi:Calpain-like cysteine peptidase [Cichlidogyrus casuarinus]|uniref:Calpain-like cysteine peptidase n=1 Tax=Cichlidogyrus casuarinus TaxID=1844966 RepID=A0ABD2QK69_9PLAT
MAALASMSTNPQLLNRCVAVGQSFREDWYAGIFCFRFWRFGHWEEVVVDDWLPVQSGGQPLFIHSGRPNEFWPALLEKAYAKLNGSYEALASTLIGDAMDDICGGLTESFSLTVSDANEFASKLPPDLDDILIKSFDRHSLITARIRVSYLKCYLYFLVIRYIFDI